MEIDLSGLDKAEVLAALYNNSKPQGMGIMHFQPAAMGREEAQELLKGGTYFDYLKGRVMKVELGGDTLYAGLYDRDLGEGAAERVISRLRDRTMVTEKAEASAPSTLPPAHGSAAEETEE